MTTSARAARYDSISHYLLEESQIQLDLGDLIQASEKCWGAAAHAVKSIAQTRGWNHHRHDLLRDIVNQISDEWDSPALRVLFDSASILHQNFYEHDLDDEDVQRIMNSVRTFVAELEALRNVAPPPFTPRTATQRRRLQKLTRAPGPPPDDVDGLPPVRQYPPNE